MRDVLAVTRCKNLMRKAISLERVPHHSQFLCIGDGSVEHLLLRSWLGPTGTSLQAYELPSAPRPPRTVVDKSVYSPWLGSTLRKSLQDTSCETVLVTGGETDMCYPRCSEPLTGAIEPSWWRTASVALPMKLTTPCLVFSVSATASM